MKTMHFEYDPERLIEEVKKRPGLWDFEDVAYRTKAIRQKLWTEVVRELMAPDMKVNVTKSEIRELELQLQKKWKSIRDCFQKYVVNPNRSKRPYIYTKKLQFLLKTEQSEQAGASTESEDGGKTSSIWRTRRRLKIKKDSSGDDDDDDDDDKDNDNDTYIYNDDAKSICSNDVGDDQIESQTPPKKIKTNNSALDEIAFANVETTQSFNDTEDSDKLFLLSLLPHLKSIPEQFKLNVKMDMMNVLRNANFNACLEHKLI